MPQRSTERRSSCRGFPAAFRPPALASWTSCPAGGFRPSHDRPTGQEPGPRRGFHVPHTRYTTGLGALFTPRPRGAHLASRARLTIARPLCQGPGPITPVTIPSTRELRMTRRHQGFTRVHPPGLLPGPPVPGWNSNRLGHHPRASHPTGQEPVTHAEAGDGQSSTRPELHHRHCRPPIDAAQSMCATSCRTTRFLMLTCVEPGHIADRSLAGHP